MIEKIIIWLELVFVPVRYAGQQREIVTATMSAAANLLAAAAA
ncbi:MAG: hypothetical protein QOI77_2177, partial [Blastocatellia bacterium]|nr:hypothetical protein [Blastocatellia bacterium]